MPDSIPKSIQREPIPILRPFIQFVWASYHEGHAESRPVPARERMIPSGAMHLVFRFSEQPIRIFKSIEDTQGDTFCGAVVGGIRAGYYVKDVAPGAATLGATLRPGACQALFGIPADEVSGWHYPLADLWGPAAQTLYEQLQEVGDFEGRLQLLESFLAARVERVSGMHPAIAHALNRFSATTDISAVVDETGYSHRHFIHLFRQTVGLPPRVYTRLLRFQRILKHGFDRTFGRWIDVALEAGYADQAHFNREFREMTGISPTEYLVNRRGDSHHVLIPGQFRSRPNSSR